MKKGNKFGTHRVIEPKGLLPQPAERIDNTMEIYDNEILIDVQTLNIDSASFTQIKGQANNDVEKIKEIMLGIVAKRGKHHNPVTGSGGMLIGTIKEIGPAMEGKTDLKVGDKIATLVSLSLTPLKIDEIIEVRKDIDQVDIKGQAILFESGIYAKLPSDIPENLALSVLDVAGAPAQTRKLVKKGDTVLVVGGAGKSGMLCLYEARKQAGPDANIICLAHNEASMKRAKDMGFANSFILADATNSVDVYEKVMEVTNGEMVDVTINCVNIPDTEMSCILATKADGVIYFFSMATSFTAAALGAEGVGMDTTMIIGNGYARDHANISLEIIRESEIIRKVYTDLYA
ncbi:zinc-binding dehydrogenase [Acidaminobacter sp. JC074]|uniref:L-erythro-3,5-diaminohexanoate dehydrogenase n=1 Tax=Acidaminobacter sp. JC074 TaxID=2530199 RepID=UPI001F1174A2|nr:zinc-binding dehydrogenase [Acidaminobacter sp. JC074]MCH4886943.1 zinc-binding dehydrogenase [Acidaminobacter sp. JC074]